MCQELGDGLDAVHVEIGMQSALVCVRGLSVVIDIATSSSEKAKNAVSSVFTFVIKFPFQSSIPYKARPVPTVFLSQGAKGRFHSEVGTDDRVIESTPL